MAPGVFLVEDDDVVTNLVRDGVAAEGWDFGHRAMMSGALDALRSGKSDVVILDLGLPDGDGVDFCRALKADREMRRIPVIMLTSRADQQNRLRGFEAGAQDYVAKPFALAELIARVRAHLSLKLRQDVIERELTEAVLHDRVRQDVVDMIVHDLKTPLATIRVTLDLVRAKGLVHDQELDRFMAYVENSSDLAMLMVNDLLDLGAQAMPVHPAEFDAGELFQRIQGLLDIQYRSKKIALRIENSLGRVRTDSALVFRVLVNLLTNALKFTPAAGEVTARGLRAGCGWRFEVQDNGTAIPDGEKELIFEKYYRTGSARLCSVPGSGIGLAFCRLAAKSLGGRIWVEDAAPRGNRFIIELPEQSPVP